MHGVFDVLSLASSASLQWRWQLTHHVCPSLHLYVQCTASDNFGLWFLWTKPEPLTSPRGRNQGSSELAASFTQPCQPNQFWKLSNQSLTFWLHGWWVCQPVGTTPGTLPLACHMLALTGYMIKYIFSDTLLERKMVPRHVLSTGHTTPSPLPCVWVAEVQCGLSWLSPDPAFHLLFASPFT